MIPVHPQVLAQHGHVQSSIGPANHGQPSRVSTAKFHRIHAKISGINGFLLLSLALRWTTPCRQDPSSSDGPLRVSNALRRYRVTCRQQESGPFVKLQRAFRAGRYACTDCPNEVPRRNRSHSGEWVATESTVAGYLLGVLLGYCLNIPWQARHSGSQQARSLSWPNATIPVRRHPYNV